MVSGALKLIRAVFAGPPGSNKRSSSPLVKSPARWRYLGKSVVTVAAVIPRPSRGPDEMKWASQPELRRASRQLILVATARHETNLGSRRGCRQTERGSHPTGRRGTKGWLSMS
jgi:hypothetical protein